MQAVFTFLLFCLLALLPGCMKSSTPERPRAQVKYQLPLDLSGREMRRGYLGPAAGWFTWQDPGRYQSLDSVKANYLSGVDHGPILSIEQSDRILAIQTIQGNMVAYYSAVKRQDGKIMPAIYGIYPKNSKRSAQYKLNLDTDTEVAANTLVATRRCGRHTFMEGGATIFNMIIPTCRP